MIDRRRLFVVNGVTVQTFNNKVVIDAGSRQCPLTRLWPLRLRRPQRDGHQHIQGGFVGDHPIGTRVMYVSSKNHLIFGVGFTIRDGRHHFRQPRAAPPPHGGELFSL